MQAPTIPWASNTLKPGKYRVTAKVEIQKNKADGSCWDPGFFSCGKPDPIVTIHLDGQDAQTCKSDDSYSADCAVILDLGANSMVDLNVMDGDRNGDDLVGNTGPFQPVGKARFSTQEFLTTAGLGQIKEASLTFEPVQ